MPGQKQAYDAMVRRLQKLFPKKDKKAASTKRVKKATAKKKSWVSNLKSKVRDNLATEDKKRQLRRSMSEADIRKLQGKKKNNPHKKSGGY